MRTLTHRLIKSWQSIYAFPGLNDINKLCANFIWGLTLRRKLLSCKANLLRVLSHPSYCHTYNYRLVIIWKFNVIFSPGAVLTPLFTGPNGLFGGDAEKLKKVFFIGQITCLMVLYRKRKWPTMSVMNELDPPFGGLISIGLRWGAGC